MGAARPTEGAAEAPTSRERRSLHGPECQMCGSEMLLSYREDVREHHCIACNNFVLECELAGYNRYDY
eukprot:g48761.t1